MLPPSLSTIRTFTDDLRFALFPEGPRTPQETASHLAHIRVQARSLIARAFAVQNININDSPAIAEELLGVLPAIKEKALLDITAALRGDPAARDSAEVIAYYPGFKAILLQRIAHELQRFGVPYLPRGITEQAHADTGIDIHPGAMLGDGLFIDHGTGVVIGETAVIGNNIKIYQGVTLGALSLPRDNSDKSAVVGKRHPTIEDNATIYANATILGGDTVIGHDSVIGASALVKKSIPAFSVIRGTSV